MPTLSSQILPAFRLTRLSLVFGAVADAWFVIVFTRGDAIYNHVPSYSIPLAVDLALAAILTIGLFAFAGTLNDLLDLRHDSTFRPDRPLPSGRIRSSQAVVIAVGSLLAAIAAMIPFGSAALVFGVLAATGILFYDAMGKYLPALGVLIAGLIHGAHMMIPNPELAFSGPVWLIFSHVVMIGVVVHMVERKRPRPTGTSIGLTVLGWIVCSVLILGLPAQGSLEGGFIPADLDLDTLIWPAAAVVLFTAIARRKLAGQPGPIGAEKLRRYGAMWHAVYASAWFAGLGRWSEAGVFFGLAILGLLAMTILREISVDDPGLVGYRA